MCTIQRGQSPTFGKINCKSSRATESVSKGSRSSSCNRTVELDRCHDWYYAGVWEANSSGLARTIIYIGVEGSLAYRLITGLAAAAWRVTQRELHSVAKRRLVDAGREGKSDLKVFWFRAIEHCHADSNQRGLFNCRFGKQIGWQYQTIRSVRSGTGEN